MRYALQVFGIEILTERDTASQKTPMMCVARHGNAFFFSGFSPDTTAAIQLRFPQGAPLMVGLETRLVGGRSRYTMPKAWHRECRVFVEQARDGRLACREVHSGMVGVSRRLQVTGLENAAVRFYHEPGSGPAVRMLVNGSHPYLVGDFAEFAVREDNLGAHLYAENVTGDLMISW